MNCGVKRGEIDDLVPVPYATRISEFGLVIGTNPLIL
jgi:hypothetical protein